MKKLNIKKIFFPQSKLGEWSLGLICLFILTYFIMMLIVASGQRGGEKFFDNLWLAMPALTLAATGVSSFITGLGGIVKQEDKGILTYASTAIGLFVLYFIIAEFAFPH